MLSRDLNFSPPRRRTGFYLIKPLVYYCNEYFFNRNSVASLDTSFDTAGSDLVLEIGYESRVNYILVTLSYNNNGFIITWMLHQIFIFSNKVKLAVG